MSEKGNFSFIVQILDGHNDTEKRERIEKQIKEKREGPITWLLVDKGQLLLLEKLGIKMITFNIHHPVSKHFWHKLDQFIARFEANNIHTLKMNKRFYSYCKTQETLMLYFGINELNDRKDFMEKLKSLEIIHRYKEEYSIPKSWHEAYNGAFRNCQPRDVIKSLDSIFDNDNYDRKRIEAILKLLYVIAILENKNISPEAAVKIENDLANSYINMNGVLARLGINKGIVREYIEDLFLPRRYNEMDNFFSMLKQINLIR